MAYDPYKFCSRSIASVCFSVIIRVMLSSHSTTVSAWVMSPSQSDVLPISPPRYGQSTTFLFSNDNVASKGVHRPFGKQEYWEEFYRDNNEQKSGDFAWYAEWTDLQPFVEEFLSSTPPTTTRILHPGIGSDVSLIQHLYSAGYTNQIAFDYAAQSIEYCKSQLSLINDDGKNNNLQLFTADARDLHDKIESDSIDMVLEKGTLDSVYLIGGGDESEKLKNLQKAIFEMQRVVRPGGVIWSLSGVCVDALVGKDDDQNHYRYWPESRWECLVDTTQNLFMTTDGYTSNNLDGSLFVWRKR